jgi:hypothetical protein
MGPSTRKKAGRLRQNCSACETSRLARPPPFRTFAVGIRWTSAEDQCLPDFNGRESCNRLDNFLVAQEPVTGRLVVFFALEARFEEMLCRRRSAATTAGLPDFGLFAAAASSFVVLDLRRAFFEDSLLISAGSGSGSGSGFCSG